MKATGVVRRIDELGRIVIPKEIRKTLRIREGENLEIFLDNESNIVLKKYSVINKLSDLASQITSAIYNLTKHSVLITDSSVVISTSGKLKKQIIDKKISEELSDMLVKRESLGHKYNEKIKITDGEVIEGTYFSAPILTNGDVVGLVMIIDDEAVVGEEDYKICQIVAQILGKYLED